MTVYSTSSLEKRKRKRKNNNETPIFIHPWKNNIPLLTLPPNFMVNKSILLYLHEILFKKYLEIWAVKQLFSKDVFKWYFTLTWFTVPSLCISPLHIPFPWHRDARNQVSPVGSPWLDLWHPATQSLSEQWQEKMEHSLQWGWVQCSLRQDPGWTQPLPEVTRKLPGLLTERLTGRVLLPEPGESLVLPEHKYELHKIRNQLPDLLLCVSIHTEEGSILRDTQCFLSLNFFFCNIDDYSPLDRVTASITKRKNIRKNSITLSDPANQALACRIA